MRAGLGIAVLLAMPAVGAAQSDGGSVRGAMGLAAGGNPSIRPGVPAMVAQIAVDRPWIRGLDADYSAIGIIQLDERRSSSCYFSCSSSWGLNLLGLSAGVARHLPG